MQVHAYSKHYNYYKLVHLWCGPRLMLTQAELWILLMPPLVVAKTGMQLDKAWPLIDNMTLYDLNTAWSHDTQQFSFVSLGVVVHFTDFRLFPMHHSTLCNNNKRCCDNKFCLLANTVIPIIMEIMLEWFMVLPEEKIQEVSYYPRNGATCFS